MSAILISRAVDFLLDVVAGQQHSKVSLLIVCDQSRDPSSTLCTSSYRFAASSQKNRMQAYKIDFHNPRRTEHYWPLCG